MSNYEIAWASIVCSCRPHVPCLHHIPEHHFAVRELALKSTFVASHNLALLSHCYDFAYLAACNPPVLDWRSLPSVEGIQDCVLVPVFAKNLLGACSTWFARTYHSSFVILIHVIASCVGHLCWNSPAFATSMWWYIYVSRMWGHAGDNSDKHMFSMSTENHVFGDTVG